MHLRRTSWLASCVLSGALVAAVGCEQSEPAPAPAPAAAEKASAPKKASREPLRMAALAPEEPKTVVEGVPTPEDFEEEAASTLSPDNLEIELDRLEAEIIGE